MPPRPMDQLSVSFSRLDVLGLVMPQKSPLSKLQPVVTAQDCVVFGAGEEHALASKQLPEALFRHHTVRVC